MTAATRSPKSCPSGATPEPPAQTKTPEGLIKMSNLDVYEAITNRMIKALESGTVPWRKPWSPATGGRPRSMSTRQPYTGINTFLLAVESMDNGHTSPWWGTYNQIAFLHLSGDLHDRVVA